MDDFRMQVGPNNVNDGERIDIQVGKILSDKTPKSKPSNSNPTKVKNVNVSLGNARVGRQEDVIMGDINI
jgi:hypothetical protein